MVKKRKGKAVKNADDAQPIKRARQAQEHDDSTLISASASSSSSSSSSSSPYPARLLHTPVAQTLYDVLTDMPADLINITTTYKQYEAADGSVYDGAWSADGKTREGFGTQVWKNGDWQQGEWKEDKLWTGRGRMTLENGTGQEGVWFKGVYSGPFEGKWDINEPYAKGIIRQISGGVYDGELHYGSFEGQGKMVDSSGDKYEGAWQKDQFHGHGVYTFANGNKYVGEFANNSPHGKGKFTYVSGQVDDGEFRVDHIVSGKRIYPNGDVYEGAFCARPPTAECEYPEEMRQGYGVFVEKESGLHYAGHWKQDKKEGFGVESDACGTRYEGEFQKGKRHGVGVLLLPNGERLCVCYDQGKSVSANAYSPIHTLPASSHLSLASSSSLSSLASSLPLSSSSLASSSSLSSSSSSPLVFCTHSPLVVFLTCALIFVIFIFIILLWCSFPVLIGSIRSLVSFNAVILIFIIFFFLIALCFVYILIFAIVAARLRFPVCMYIASVMPLYSYDLCALHV